MTLASDIADLADEAAGDTFLALAHGRERLGDNAEYRAWAANLVSVVGGALCDGLASYLTAAGCSDEAVEASEDAAAHAYAKRLSHLKRSSMHGGHA